jgi:LuxR family maltose regulon positive regulatory protein
LSVEADCVDPVRFWSYVLAALRFTRALPPDSPLLHLDPPPAVDADFVGRVIDGVAQLPGPVVLVLDDVQDIGTGTVVDGLAFLLRHLPDQLRLVLLGRADPPLPLHRMRASGHLAEIRPADLAFTPDETRRLAARHDLDLTDGEVRSLLARTEGWPAGLRLAVLSVRDQEDLSGAIERITGDTTRGIADYLMGEVLDGQPPEIRQFLLRTSVVDRFTPELAGLLSGAERSREVLDRLGRSDDFVVALDDRGTWYRYHNLLRDLLRHRLAVESPETVPELHRRAAGWFAVQGAPLETVRHAMAAGAYDLLGRYVTGHAASLILDPSRSAVAALLRGVPAQVSAEDGELAAVAAFAHSDDPEPGELHRHLRAATARLDQLPGGRRGPEALSVRLLEAMAARRSSDPAGAAELAADVLSLAADLTTEQVPGLADYRALALVSRGKALVWLGRLDEAERSLVAGLAALDGRGLSTVQQKLLADGYLGLVSAMRGRLGEAQRRARAAVELGERIGWSYEQVLTCAYLTLVLVELQRADDKACAGVLGRARAVLDRRPDGLLDVACQLARVRLLLDRGDGPRAWEIIDAVAAEIARWPNPAPFLLRWLDVIRAEADLALGNPAGVVARLAARADSEEISDRPSAHELVLLARARLDLGDAAAAAALVEHLPAAAGVDGGPATEAAVVTALAADRMGRESRAMDALSRALAAAEDERFLRPFLLAGRRLRPLLLRHREMIGRHGELVAELLDRFEDARPPQPAVPPGEEITERELAVLALLPTMMNNTDIAAELFISVNTVKSHLRALYRKLGVTSRRAAVEQARRRGLLVDR